MLIENFEPTEEERDHFLWDFIEDPLHILDKQYLENHATRFKLEIISRKDHSCSQIFHDDGVCMRDDLVLDRKLILLDSCIISASKIIEFRNCIFTGDVKILLEDTDCSPSIHNSIFLGKLSISLSNSFFEESARPSLEITNSFVKNLILQSSCLSLVNIYGSVFYTAEFLDSQSSSFRVRENKFGSLSFADFFSGKTYFGPDQIPMNPIIESNRTYYALVFFYDAISHIKSCTRSRKTEYRRKADTLEFLLKEADLRSNQNTKAHLKYLQLIDRSPRGPVRFFVWMSGGLLKPYRLLACSMLCILLYSLLYWISIDELKPAESYWDCLYFSAISFTTIGFGDILPSGFARLLAVSEGLAGIVFSSSLVASIIRKYTE